MKSVIEEGFIGVDMPPLPDEIWRGVRLLQLTEPVFTAYTASTTSATFTAWLSPVTEAATYSDTASLYGIFCANNPVNFTDPFGLCEDGPGFWGLWGNALNNTVSAVNFSIGQGLYDLSQGEWNNSQWDQIDSLLWSTQTPAAPQATPYIATALGVSAAAAATAAIAGTVDAVTGVRVEIHGTHGGRVPPHLQGIQGSPGVHPYEWGETIWRWPPH